MKRSLRIGLLGLLTSATAFAGALTLNVQKNEIVSADTNFTMEMEDGAAVRLVGTDEKEYGIKYTAKLATDSYDQDAKYYVMIIPTGWLTRYNLSESYDVNCDYYGTLSAQADIADRLMTMEATPQFVEDENCYYFEGSIKTVKYENSFREYFGIAYSEKNGVRTYAEFDEGENIRSVSQVASAALNDKTAGWTDTQKASLKKMVQTAYNASLDSDYTNQEEAELPTISAESVKLALESGKTYQLSAPAGIPENIGIQVKYATGDEAQATVSQEGLMTMGTIDAGTTVTATVLGEDYTLANVVPDSTVLHDFSSADSYKDLRTKTDETYSATHHESVTLGGETRNGVVSAKTDSNGYFFVSFADNLETLSAIGSDFDYVSISLYTETSVALANNQFAFGNYSMTTNTIEANKWQEVIITKDYITGGSDLTDSTISFYNSAISSDSNFTDKTNLLGYFWHVHASDSPSKFKTVPLIRTSGTLRANDAATVYIDSISVVRAGVEYTVPNSGEEFTVPTATLKGVDGALLAIDNKPTVTYQASATAAAVDVTLENGKFTVMPGSYSMSYTLTGDEANYTKETSFEVARAEMAANMLEDFDSAESVANLWNPNTGSMTTEQKAQNVWLASYTDGSDVEKSGVVSVNGYGKSVYLKFNRSVDELETLLTEDSTISITLLWVRSAGSTVPTKVFGVSLTGVSLNSWKTYEISVGDILTALNLELDTFLTKVASDGDGSGAEIWNDIGSEATLYVADIAIANE